MTPTDLERDSAYDEETIGRVGKQSFLKGLVDNASDGLLTIDASSTIVFANPAVERIFGYRPDELLGEPLTTLIPERLRRQHLDAIQRYLRTGERQLDWDSIELPGVHEAGHEVPIEVSFREVQQNGQRLFTGIIKDITERRENERKLELRRGELQAELDEILERISDAFFALDDEWRFTYVNEQAEALLDRTAADLLGEDVWEQFPDAVGSTFQVEYERAMATQTAVAFEEYYPPLDAWFEVSAYPSETGLSVYFRDVTERKQYEGTLSTLHGATRDLVGATSPEEIGDLAVETAADVIDISGVAVYLFDPAEGVLDPVSYTDELRDVIGELPSFKPGEGIAGRVFIEGTVAVYDDVRESEDVHNPETRMRSEMLVPLGDHGVLIAGSTEPGIFDDRTRELVRILATTTETAFDRLEREQDLRDRDRELRERNERLTELDRINRLIRQIDRVLVDVSTREGIEEAVCDRLTDADQFAFAWIGVADADERTVTPRSWAGDGQSYLDDVPAMDGTDATAAEPAVRAARSREPVVVADVANRLREEPWRQAALARDFRSVISVPLLYEEFSYGVLTIYASGPEAFGELAADVFEELGGGIAHAINAVETKQGLLFHRVVELDVRIREANDVLHRLAAEAGCDVGFEGVIPQPDSSLVFFSTAGASPERVRSLAQEHVGVDAVRLVTANDDECFFEAAISDSLVASTIVDHGGVPRTITTDGSELLAHVDLPHTTDVRDFIDRLRKDYPDAELVARRERERSVETRQGFEAELEASLTDRQSEALRTAFLGGFFDEPRTSTGRELGAALGITQPTFSSHLRAAQRRLLSMLFDGE